MKEKMKPKYFISNTQYTWGLILLLLAIYLPVLGMDFALDDYFIIVNNQYNSDWSQLWTIISTDLWSGDPTSATKTSFYRPLFSVSLLIDRSIAGLNPMWHHGHSLLWFLVCVLLLLQLLKQFFPVKIALLAVLIFALHPIQTETVAWVSARNDSMAATFVLGALLAFCRKKPFLFLGGLLSFCAALSKENTFFLPLWALMLSNQSQMPRRYILGAGTIAIGCALIVRKLVGVQVHWPDSDHWSLLISNWQYFFSDSIGLILAPWPLAPTRSLAWIRPSTIHYIGTGALIFSMIIGTMWIWKKRQQYINIALAGLLIFWGAWLPSILATTINSFYGDRYLFLPLIGLAIWIGIFLDATTLKWKRVYLCLFIPCVFLIVKKIPDWKNDQALWFSMVRDLPSPFTHVSLAHIVYNQGKFNEAASLYEKSYADTQPWLAGCDTYVASVLNTKGPSVAYQKSLWAITKGCQMDGKMGGIMALSLGLDQNWKELRKLLPQLQKDPTERGDIAFAAILILDGKIERFKKLKESWNNPQDKEALLLRMLKPSGIKSLP